MRPVLRTICMLSLFVCCIVPMLAGRAAAAIDATLVPSASTVHAGTEFEVRIHVTNPGVEFNTYEAYIGYDPAFLTFVPSSPLSLQEGAYMTTACGNTFHLFQPSATVLHITHSLLCANQFLVTGGDVYILHFQAKALAGNTQITFNQIQFLRGGNPATAGTLTNATVQISSPTDAGVPTATHLRVRVTPNPFNPTAVVTIESAQAGFQRVLVHDMRGRLLATLGSGDFPAGTRRVIWSGQNASGQHLPSGAYVLSVQTPNETRSQRVFLIK